MNGAPDLSTPQGQAIAIFDNACRAYGCVGASFAVAQNGLLLVSHGFGMADLENHVPATGTTVCDIGSVPKVMTAVAVILRRESAAGRHRRGLG
jgi:CubicO group peptidase (beta-lactamase class C family)